MKFLRITGFFMLYLLLCSKGCNDREEKSSRQETVKIKATQDSILSKFSSDILAETSLRAFEENAKQKLADFADYFRIMSDTSLDTSFRNQALKMIKDLFYKGNLQLELTLPGNTKENNISLEELITHDFLSKFGMPEMILDSIHVSDLLHYDALSMYTGKLAFRQGFKARSDNGPVAIKPTWKEVFIIVCKRPKLFGKDTLEIWQAFLGQIQNSKI